MGERPLPITLWMRPAAMLKQVLPVAVGGLIAVLIVSFAGGGWHFGLVGGLVLGTMLVCSVSRVRLTDTGITLRRGWSRASRRWVDLAVQENASDVRFILFDETEEEPGRASRFVSPGDYERGWQGGRIGSLLREHHPGLLLQVESRDTRG